MVFLEHGYGVSCPMFATLNLGFSTSTVPHVIVGLLTALGMLGKCNPKTALVKAVSPIAGTGFWSCTEKLTVAGLAPSARVGYTKT